LSCDFDVVLAGYYGFGNLGDELLAESALQLLQKSGVKRERIAILSSSPQKTSKELGIESFDRWNLLEVYRTIRRSRTLLLGGGGLFQDSTSVMSCVYYWGLVLFARLAGTRPWAAGQSIGPLRSPAAKWLAKSAFSSCVFRGVRDPASFEQLCRWGLEGAISPDLVMGLAVNKNPVRGNVLLLNLRGGYDRLAIAGARKALKFAEQNNLSIKAVAFSPEDVRVLCSFQEQKIIDFSELVHVKTLKDFEAAAQGVSYAVGMRLHFLILSFLSELSVCAIPYDPKVYSLAMEYNIPVMSAEHGSINFSGTHGGELPVRARENLSQFFRAGVRKVLAQT